MLHNILWSLVPISYMVIWWKGAQVREVAIEAAIKRCNQYQVQFLDGTVVRCGWRFIRNHKGQIVLERRFSFEFSPDGESRYSGLIISQAKKILSTTLEPYPDPNAYDFNPHSHSS